ncbi:MAG TPA: MarC family protein [Verrucomicrobiae bacterium]|jgi:multiple antibiotic resistance protein
MTLGAYSILAVTSIFVILDPIATVPAFVAMTPNDTQPSRLRMARLACWVSAGVLALFAAAGNLIFRVMGITLPAFQMAGSILLLRIALDMLYARRSEAQETDEEVAAGAVKDDIAITPLAVPMMAGPGAISTVLILENQAEGAAQMVVLFASIALVCFVSYWVFWLAVHGTHYVKPLALKLMTRLFGLVLASMAVQFFLNGLEQTPFFKR